MWVVQVEISCKSIASRVRRFVRRDRLGKCLDNQGCHIPLASFKIDFLTIQKALLNDSNCYVQDPKIWFLDRLGTLGDLLRLTLGECVVSQTPFFIWPRWVEVDEASSEQSPDQTIQLIHHGEIDRREAGQKQFQILVISSRMMWSYSLLIPPSLVSEIFICHVVEM